MKIGSFGFSYALEMLIKERDSVFRTELLVPVTGPRSPPLRRREIELMISFFTQLKMVSALEGLIVFMTTKNTKPSERSVHEECAFVNQFLSFSFMYLGE